MALRLALSSGAFYPRVQTEDVPFEAARLGIDEVELLLQTAGEYESTFIRTVAQNAASAGVRIHAVHTFHGLHPFFTAYARRTEEARQRFAQAVEAAHMLGAQAVIWHGATREEAREANGWERFLAVAADLAGLCHAAGITLAIENVSWCVVATVRETRALAERLSGLGPPGSIGFAFDPFQAAEAGANPFMILAAMDGHIVDVHLSDRRANDPARRHLPPGDGELPWPALLRAIAGSGYDGPLVVEGALGNDPPATMARVRACLDPVLMTLSAGPDLCAGTLPPGVEEGIRLFNEGRFYECHEAIEHEWHAERSPVRTLYQGILQIGVGFHHARGGNYRGAVALLRDGIAKVSRFVPRCRGIDTARLMQESQACLDRIIELGPDRLAAFDWSNVPRVHLLDAQQPEETRQHGDCPDCRAEREVVR